MGPLGNKGDNLGLLGKSPEKAQLRHVSLAKQNSDMKFVLVTFSVSIVFAAKDSALPGCSHRIPGQFYAVTPPCAFAAFHADQGRGKIGRKTCREREWQLEKHRMVR